MLTIQELKSSNLTELERELSSAQTELLKIRIALKTKHEKDSSKSKKTKRYIAKIKTIISELKIEDSKESKATLTEKKDS